MTLDGYVQDANETIAPVEQQNATNTIVQLEDGKISINGIIYKPMFKANRKQNNTPIPRIYKKWISNISRNTGKDITAIAEEALKAYLDTEAEKYLPFDNSECSTVLTYYITEDVDKILQERKQLEGRSINQIVQKALVEFIDRNMEFAKEDSE